MKMNMTDRRWVSRVCFLCLALAVTFTGCAPLKKKFMRQKKKDKETNENFIPVLEPEEYQVRQVGPFEEYSQHYLLFNVWISDFGDNFQTMDNDKRLISDLESALKSISAMQKLSTGTLAESIAKITKQVKYLLGEYDQPEAFRNPSRMSSEVRSIERSLRRDLKPDLVKDQLFTK